MTDHKSINIEKQFGSKIIKKRFLHIQQQFRTSQKVTADINMSKTVRLN